MCTHPGPAGRIHPATATTKDLHDHRPSARSSSSAPAPPGYTAAIYAARANLKPLVFEGAVTAGGALMNTTDVENFPGFHDGIMGPQLMDEMRAQAERFGAELVTDDVTEVDLTGEVKEVTDGEGTVHHARAVILATGSGYRKLGHPRRGAALRPRCLVVRHLRRVLLPRPGDRRRRGR